VREAARRHADTFQRDTLLEPLETRMRAFVRPSTVQELSS
jgi:hypothetical protein